MKYGVKEKASANVNVYVYAYFLVYSTKRKRERVKRGDFMKIFVLLDIFMFSFITPFPTRFQFFTSFLQKKKIKYCFCFAALLI